jgi:hypothetical protein
MDHKAKDIFAPSDYVGRRNAEFLQHPAGKPKSIAQMEQAAAALRLRARRRLQP